MITVVVFGQKPERMARLTAAVLCRYGAVRLSLQGSLEAIGIGSVKYSIEATSRLERLTVPQSVLVLSDQSAPRRLEMGRNTIVVTGSDNRRMSRLMKGKTNPVVTCGTGVRDTVTLSSSAGERVLLCAQRRLPLVTGKWLEPLEFTAEIKGCSMRGALLTAATAAVCGCGISEGIIEGESPPVTV